MNLNMQAFNINTLLGGLDKVRDVMGVYQQQLLLSTLAQQVQQLQQSFLTH